MGGRNSLRPDDQECNEERKESDAHEEALHYHCNDETQLLLFTVSAPPRPNPFKASLEVNECTVFGAPEVDE